jgi:PAS domain S-box-containing protein
MLRHIALHHPHLPVIMLTGQGNEAVAVEALRAGAIDYLPKLDLDQLRLSQAVDRAVHRANAGTHPASEQISVLLVEDNPEDREVYRRTLESLPFADYRCMEAASGTAGLELARSRGFNCVLLDHMLPDTTGLDMLESLREQDPFLPVILLTGQGSEWLAVESIRRGAYDYLPKASLNPERLNHAIKAATAGAGRKRELAAKDLALKAKSAALAESEETFRTAMEHAPIGMSIIRRDGGFVQVNKALCDMLGYTAEELLKLDVLAITHPEDIASSLETRDRLEAGEIRSVQSRKRYLRKDGSVIWVEVNTAGIPMPEGPPQLAISQAQDITAMREAEHQREALIEELRARTDSLTLSEETFRAAMEHAPIGMRISSLSGRMLRVNQAFCDMLGYRAEELIGTSGFAILHPDDAARDREGIGRLLRGEINIFVIDKRYIHHKGHTVWAQVHGSVVTNPDGTPRHLLSQVIDVTGVREAERQREALIEELRAKTAALEASEELFRSAMDLAPIGMRMSSAEGRYLRVNNAFCNMLGYNEAELLAADPLTFSHPEEVEADRRDLQALLTGEFATYRREKRYLHKDGHIVWGQVYGLVVRNLEGAPRHILSQVLDVTKLREAQAQRESLISELSAQTQALESSETLFRTAMDLAPIGMRIAATDGKFLRVNRAFCEMVGYSEEELLKLDAFTISHPEDEAPLRAEVARLLAGEIKSYQMDKRYFHKDGHIIWAQVHASVVANPDGSPKHVLSQVLDVTKLREAQAQREELIDRLRAKTEALEASEALFRTAMDEAPIGMKIVALDGRFVRVNKAFCDLLGFTNEEMLTMDFQRITHLEDLPRDIEGMQRMLAGEITNYEAEKRYFHKDGHTIWCVVTGAIVKNSDGRMQHLISQVQDISKIKQAQQQREKLIEELITSNTELERFAYIASHDMQEPLRMITNFSQIISDDYKDLLDEEGREYLQIVRDSGERMRDIVNDLLEYAKIGHKETGLTLVDGALELAHILDNLKILIKETKAVISYDKLPAFRGNPVQFMRLLQNLITNAIKYQPSGNQPVIHIGVADQELQWCISVKDNGIGIDERFTNTVFQPFRRLHSWNEIPGTGIGLAVCKKIVENHGGAIWVESEPGQGSVFYFTVPKKSLTPEEVQ